MIDRKEGEIHPVHFSSTCHLSSHSAFTTTLKSRKTKRFYRSESQEEKIRIWRDEATGQGHTGSQSSLIKSALLLVYPNTE